MSSGIDELPRLVHAWQSAASREAHNASVLTKEHRAGQYNESVGTLAAHRGEPTGEIAAQAHSHRIDDRKSPEGALCTLLLSASIPLPPPSIWR